ncbi:glycosyltransferase family protein [Prochlorococcus sp. MIT 1307]|uniref:glycosyltransferase family protein n=1 Tax=Prochlorococcus sp. MIT 1307 TaxID=3096219 RepID=UPI002A7536AF|nr:glycosyltransferase family protein [Prochlorococcus sp. MIT 1307]
MKIVSTIEARMTSSRLPGKVLLRSKGIPLLGHLVNRLKKVESIDEIVLATTTKKTDNVLESFANEYEIGCFRGEEDDVMKRVINAGEEYKADVIVEITGDCPLIDPGIIEQVIRTFKANKCDFVNNNTLQSYPDGMDTRVITLAALKKSYLLTDNVLDKEHVTLHIKNNPDLFKIINLVAPPDLHWPELGLTLDEYDDYKLINKVIESLYDKDPFFKCIDILNYLRKNLGLVLINKDVLRKGDT